MTGSLIERPILLFDGVCNFCNGTVNFIIKQDKKELFLFAALQSHKGEELLQQLKQNDSLPDSVVLLYNGKVYNKSAAVLQVCRLLGGIWSLLLVAYVIPPFIRDAIYNYVAAHRYKWFGRRDACMVPSPSVRKRFLS